MPIPGSLYPPPYLFICLFIIVFFPLPSVSTFDIMIIVHSILSEIKLETALHSFLGYFLGAKHFFKGF